MWLTSRFEWFRETPPFIPLHAAHAVGIKSWFVPLGY